MTNILVSADVETKAALERLVSQTFDLPNVLGYKLGALCSLALGLGEAMRVIRSYSDKQVIYDHQKAGNDIPDISSRLVKLAATSGVTGFILFPFAGPEVIRAMITEAREQNITPIVGGHMTHASFIDTDGGFISLIATQRIFELAADLGVKDFVVPGNRMNVTLAYVSQLSQRIGSFTLWVPGIGRQGGDISELRSMPREGITIVPILGSSIYLSANPRAELQQLITR
jgi:orotidine-5'-phosphate decarboxylase